MIQSSFDLVLIIGMHRSGTSAMAGLLHHLYREPDLSLSGACEDNPSGYWEVPAINHLNNRLLIAAQSRWNDFTPAQLSLLSKSELDSFRQEALRILDHEIEDWKIGSTSSALILKDPRISRLLCFWIPLFRDRGVRIFPIFMIRSPIEVALSLQARVKHPDFKPAGIVSASSALLLWYRYQMDVLLDCRLLNLNPVIVDFNRLHRDSRMILDSLIMLESLPEGALIRESIDRAISFIRLDLYRNKKAAGGEDGRNDFLVFESVYQQLNKHATILSARHDEAKEAADATAVFDQLCETYQPLRADILPSRDEDPWSQRILKALSSSSAIYQSEDYQHNAALAKRQQQPFIALVSGAPNSVGHVYRVEHIAQALVSAGWRVEIMELSQLLALVNADVGVPAAPRSVRDEQAHTAQKSKQRMLDAVYLYRLPWQSEFDSLVKSLRQRGIRIVFGIDDLIFDPHLVEKREISFIADLDAKQQSSWHQRCIDYRRCLMDCDHAIVTTSVLADACLGLVGSASVLPNGISPCLESAAAAVHALPRAPRDDGRVSIGFASGTATHQADFAVISQTLAALLHEEPRVQLVIIGPLRLDEFSSLQPFADRILRRPRVDLAHLYHELVDIDINVCPLEDNRLFNEAKSALRFINAAMVAVPSVVSDTAPLREAVVHGHTGFIAKNPDEWLHWLQTLLRDPGLRARIGEAAMRDVHAQYGWNVWQKQCSAVFAKATFPAS